MSDAEQRLVLGTAGHIDHGKTALIRALTGVDTDRLPEEKARGITIELGFAPLDIGGRRVSVVDVPGHEGLVRTMVAGATGIDLALLVVAADEGVMPQTREHVAICELLGIRRGVVALTKKDVAPEDVALLAAEEVALLLETTSLHDAPIVPVSAITGFGLDALREALAAAIGAAGPRTPRSGPPRLAIDRSFAARGFGSVVTGTLVGSAFSLGEEVEIYPRGIRARVRGVQSHGVSAERATPGARTALNLQGAGIAELARGSVVSLPGALAPTNTLDAELWWLDSAPETSGPTSVEFLVGTAERRARIAPIGEEKLKPGSRGVARIHLEGEALPLLPGDRFIVRGFARTALCGATLGGGRVLDVAPPHRRRSDPELGKELERLAAGDALDGVRVRIARAGLAGIARERLVVETGLGDAALATALDELADAGETAATQGGVWLHAAALASIERRLTAALDAYHAAEPIRPGMPRAALRGQLPENVPRHAAELAIARLSEAGGLCIEDDLVRRSSHRTRLSAADESAAERVVVEAQAAGLDPPSPRDWAERLGVAPERMREVLAHLERSGSLVHAPGDLWFDRAAVDDLRRRVIAHLEEHGRLKTPDYKALIGTTRRTAVPLMELFDEERLTMRRGDARLLRSPPSR